MSRSSRSRADPSRSCSPRPPGAARPRCWSSASSGRSARTGSRPRRSSRSRSPTAPPVSCASASASGCSRSASARRPVTPRPPRSARSTDSAHGCCASHPLPAGLDPEFTILDEGLAGRLRERAFRSALSAFLDGQRTDAVDLVAAYNVERLQGMIESVHARLRSRGQRSPRLELAPAEEGADDDASDALAACVLLDELLVGFTEAYEALKDARRAVDFDDLELRARALLEDSPSVRTACSERFELLMVDEFQDTNPRQLGILEALERGNLFTVGDEFQSIYGFRHAEVGLFRDRRTALSRAWGQSRAEGQLPQRRAPARGGERGLLGSLQGLRQAPRRPRGRAAARAARRAAADRQRGLGGGRGARCGDRARPAGGRPLAPGRGAPARPAGGRARGGRERARG